MTMAYRITTWLGNSKRHSTDLWMPRNQPVPPATDAGLCLCDCGKHQTLPQYVSVPHLDWIPDDAETEGDFEAALMDVAEAHGDVEFQLEDPRHGNPACLELHMGDLLVAVTGTPDGATMPTFRMDHCAHPGDDFHDPIYIDLTWTPCEGICSIDGVTYVRFEASE